MMKHQLCILAALLLTSSSLAQSPQDLVKKFPVKTPAEESALVAQLLAQGGSAVKQVCAMVQPPGSTDDTAARFAVTGLMRHAGRPGAEPDRKTVATAIAESIEAADDAQVKAFFIARLQEIGKDESVGALAKCLTDERLCPPAAAALERIGTPAAVDALAKALPAAKPACRIPLIKSLGALRAESAVAEIHKYAAADDPALSETSLWALANISSEEAIQLANSTLKQSPPSLPKSKLLSWMLLGARRQADAGRANEAVQGCKVVLGVAESAPHEFTHVAGAALHLLTDVQGDAALGELVKAALSDNIQLRAAALDAAGRIKSPDSTRQWLNQLRADAQTSPAARVDILDFLARRGDASALATVLESLKSTEAPVRLAAAQAAARLDPKEAIAPLVDLVVKQPAQGRPVAEILARMPGDPSLKALAAATKEAPAESKIIILDTLAARVSTSNKPVVLEQTNSDDAAVRIAALRALERIGDESDVPRLVALALSAKDGSEEQAALKAAVAAGADQVNPDRRAQPLLDALGKAQGTKRAALSRALAKIGGQKALDALVADLKSEDKTIREGAIRALAESTDSAAVVPLLTVATAESTPLAQQVIALRGVVTVTKSSQLSPEEKVNAYAQALGAARRPEEKKLVIAALAGERTPQSLDVVAPLLEDETLKSEAALAVVKIVAPLERRQRGLTGDKAYQALKKATPLCSDASAKSDAERYLNRIAPKN